ncbi:MAG: response regulator [Rhizobiales bacterium]|nr:response regulator [Hyphomicrobiales bacterium]
MSSEDQAASSSVLHRTSIRILVIDDDVDAATGVAELLEMEGHTVAVAHDGAGALQSAMLLLPEIALIDLRLKGEWGLDVMHTLRGQFPNTINIIMTGESDSNTVVKALRQGIYDYLMKPFEPDQMIEVIERAAEKIRLQDEQQLMVDNLAVGKKRAQLASRSKSAYLSRLASQMDRQFGEVAKLSKLMAEQQAGSDIDADFKKIAESVSVNHRQLARVAMWISELDQLEAGSMKASIEPFNLEEITQKVLKAFQQSISAKQLKVSVNCSPELPELNSDPEYFARLLGHLISNAVKFTNPSGSVEIAASVLESGDLRLDVIDDGVGFLPNRRERARTAFTQLGNAPEPDPHGVGLGLTLADKLTALLGGQLSIETSPGQGCRVQMRFSKDIIGSTEAVAASA